MWMTGHFLRVSPTILAWLLADTTRIEPLLDASADDGELLDVEKAWHGIHYLLAGDPWAGESALADVEAARGRDGSDIVESKLHLGGDDFETFRSELHLSAEDSGIVESKLHLSPEDFRTVGEARTLGTRRNSRVSTTLKITRDGLGLGSMVRRGLFRLVARKLGERR